MLSKAQVREIQTQKSFKIDSQKLENSSLYIVNKSKFYVAQKRDNQLSIEGECTLDFKEFTLKCNVSKILENDEAYGDAVEFFNIKPSLIDAIYILDII